MRKLHKQMYALPAGPIATSVYNTASRETCISSLATNQSLISRLTLSLLATALLPHTGGRILSTTSDHAPRLGLLARGSPPGAMASSHTAATGPGCSLLAVSGCTNVWFELQSHFTGDISGRNGFWESVFFETLFTSGFTT